MLGVSPLSELVNTPDPDPSVVLLSDTVGFVNVLQQTPRVVTVAPPSSVILPPLSAVISVTPFIVAVVKMGVITISRIATQIIAVFSCDRGVDEQFKFFSDVRFFPQSIYVCINKVDLLEGDKNKKLEGFKKKITDFFSKRKINITDTFITCGETIEGFEDIETYNNAVAEMILAISTKG